MSLMRCSCFGVHITFVKLPPLVLLQPNNTDGMLLCIHGEKSNLNVMFKMLLFKYSRLQVIHVSPFLHVDLIPLTHSFN